MDPVTAAAGTFVGKEMLKYILKSIHDTCRETTQKGIEQFANSTKLNAAYKKILKYGLVKTLWQVDKPVNIKKFYCDSKILIGDNRTTVKSIEDLPEDENIVIEGIAGQGKSILLRYMCIREAEKGARLPIFIELCRLSEEAPLERKIFEYFKHLGLEDGAEIFDKLASKGHVVLLLDAFDEIKEDYKATTIASIEELSIRYDLMRIIITSRHENKIQYSSHFNVVRLDNLKGNEYKDVVKKLGKNDEFSSVLIEHLDGKAKHVKELLCTPLLVTLLVMAYKYNKTLPTNLSQFYESLFPALLSRHDGSKPTFSRERRCNIDDTEYKRVFECFCMLARERGPMEQKVVFELARRASEETNIPVKPANYIDDIVKITCMVLKEGDEYRFIHKTVKEFYTASYVASKPESWAQRFYTLLLPAHKSYGWMTELGFLSEIDAFRYRQYFFIPTLLALFDADENSIFEIKTPLSKAALHKLLDGFYYSPFGESWRLVKPYSGIALADIISDFVLYKHGVPHVDLKFAYLEDACVHPKYKVELNKIPRSQWDTYDTVRPTIRLNFSDFLTMKSAKFILPAAQYAFANALQKVRDAITSNKAKESTDILSTVLNFGDD
ncbi:NACHT domain-containing protein [Humidesulfovibrio idahonensis]